MTKFDLSAFRQQLGETIQWCRARFSLDDIRGSLRALEPYSTDLLGTLETDLIKDFGNDIFDKRRKLLSTEKSVVTPKPVDLAGGRLLIFIISLSLFDGTAEVVSQGFFDVFNYPPADTWVYVGLERDRSSKGREPDVKRNLYYLVSWIPPQALNLAQEAIDLNAEECIQWIEDVDFDFEFIKLLEAEGFVPAKKK